MSECGGVPLIAYWLMFIVCLLSGWILRGYHERELQRRKESQT